VILPIFYRDFNTSLIIGCALTLTILCHYVKYLFLLTCLLTYLLNYSLATIFWPYSAVTTLWNDLCFSLRLIGLFKKYSEGTTGSTVGLSSAKICLRNDLYCVGWGVKLYTHSLTLPRFLLLLPRSTRIKPRIYFWHWFIVVILEKRPWMNWSYVWFCTALLSIFLVT